MFGSEGIEEMEVKLNKKQNKILEKWAKSFAKSIKPYYTHKVSMCYIAGKYRGKTSAEIKENIMIAEWYQLQLTKMYPQYFYICPHSNTAFLDGSQSDEYFLDGTMELLRRCDAIYMLPSWQGSEGSKKELKEANRLGIKDVTEELEV
jgi:hypothetical protein